MTGVNRFDLRQSIYRTYLNMLARKSDFNTNGYNALGNIMAAVNTQVTPAFAMTANDPVSLVVNVGANKVANSETDIRHANPPINKQWPNFTGGTITLPSTSGGSITVSPTIQPAPTLTLSPGQTVLGLVEVDSLGNLSVTLGTAGTSESTAAFPGLNSKALQIGIIVISNTGGTIDNMTGAKLIQFVGGGGSGLGTGGSGAGDDLDALQYVASFTDNLSELPTDTAVAVDYSSGKTQSVNYSSQNNLIRISYDASKTVTGTGTAMTLSSAPAYTMAVGDILVVGSQARRITVVSSQTVFTIESAFTSNPSAAACTVSQAIYTKDLYNSAIDGVSAYSILGTSISEILLKYDDSTTLGQTIPAFDTVPVIGYTASVDGSTYSSVTLRSTNVTDVDQPLDLPTSGTNLYIRFFANATSGSGAVNLLKYKVFFGRQQTGATGNTIQQALAILNGSGTAVNCSVLPPVSGKTRIQMTWSYPLNAASGLANGALTVYINGQKVPRYVAGATIGAYYNEITPNVIELDNDYSSLSYEIEIVYNTSVIDASSTNSTDLAVLQEISKVGFQSFVNSTSAMMVATTNAGTPAAGTFYSSISNRAPITDLSQNLKAQMGVSRHMVQDIYQSQSEFGPNGETVWLSHNDQFSQVRLVGSGWNAPAVLAGTYPLTANNGDYIEITFYGTGLNLLDQVDSAVRSYLVSVDGGSGSVNAFTGSAVLNNRNYPMNVVRNMTSGLSLGVHTVTIKQNASGGPNLSVYGFEVLNESANVRVNAGIAYNSGKKMVNLTPASFAYNSMVTGTAGGRVLVYQKADGTIGSAFTAAAGSPLYLGSASNATSEMARTYYPREFGSGRSDDFSSLTTSLRQAAFTLDDGTTTLNGSSVAIESLLGDGVEGVVLSSGSIMAFMFVGTGLDIVTSTDGTSRPLNIAVDGTSVGTLTPTLNTRKKYSVVSGLAYGTHVIYFYNPSGFGSMDINKFIVYQPMTPALPAGAVSLASYNVMGNYSPIGTAGLANVSAGVLRKMISQREATYYGSWAFQLDSTLFVGGTDMYATAATSYVEYTFFGTGFDFRFISTTNACTDVRVTLQDVTDGGSLLPLTSSNFATASFGVIGPVSYDSTTNGSLNQNTATTYGSGMHVSNLPLKTWKVRLTNNNGNILYAETLDVIVPIHSHKSNLPASLQNVLTVGSQSIGDERKFSPVISESPKKNWAKATGVIASPSVSSTIPVPMPDMSCTIQTNGGDLSIKAAVSVAGTGTQMVYLLVYVDGQSIDQPMACGGGSAFPYVDFVINTRVGVSPGVHKVTLYWWANSGATIYGNASYRSLLVEEV